MVLMTWFSESGPVIGPYHYQTKVDPFEGILEIVYLSGAVSTLCFLYPLTYLTSTTVYFLYFVIKKRIINIPVIML